MSFSAKVCVRVCVSLWVCAHVWWVVSFWLEFIDRRKEIVRGFKKTQSASVHPFVCFHFYSCLDYYPCHRKARMILLM